jgi:hypothetical protein
VIGRHQMVGRTAWTATCERNSVFHMVMVPFRPRNQSVLASGLLTTEIAE